MLSRGFPKVFPGSCQNRSNFLHQLTYTLNFEPQLEEAVKFSIRNGKVKTEKKSLEINDTGGEAAGGCEAPHSFRTVIENCHRKFSWKAMSPITKV